MSCTFTLAAPGRQHVTAVAVRSDGLIAIGGFLTGDVDFGDGPLSAADGGEYGGFVAELDTGCRPQWSRSFAQTVSGLAFDPAGDLWVAGGGVGGPKTI